MTERHANWGNSRDTPPFLGGKRQLNLACAAHWHLAICAGYCYQPVVVWTQGSTWGNKCRDQVDAGEVGLFPWKAPSMRGPILDHPIECLKKFSTTANMHVPQAHLDDFQWPMPSVAHFNSIALHAKNTLADNLLGIVHAHCKDNIACATSMLGHRCSHTSACERSNFSTHCSPTLICLKMTDRCSCMR